MGRARIHGKGTSPPSSPRWGWEVKGKSGWRNQTQAQACKGRWDGSETPLLPRDGDSDAWVRSKPLLKPWVQTPVYGSRGVLRLEWESAAGETGAPESRASACGSLAEGEGGKLGPCLQPPPSRIHPARMIAGRRWGRTLGGCDKRTRVSITPIGRSPGARGRGPLHLTLGLRGRGHAAAGPTFGLRVSAGHSRPQLPNGGPLPGEPA